jgi:DNA polymerase III epsilon subunit family exonuclease
MDRPFVILDTETATLAGAPHLVELGAVRAVRGDAVEHFESLVRSQVPIEPEATDIHGIDEDDVRDAPAPEEVLERFREFVGDDWMVAHNAGFDARVLGFEYERYGLAPPDGPVLDTLALARALLPESPDHKLGTLVDHLGLDTGTAHRALADAVACWQVLEACVDRLGGWDALTEAELLRRGGSPATLAQAGPQRPRRHASVVRRLERARREGAEVRLVYGGSSESPVPLPVRPGLLYTSRERAYLEGECLLTGTIKTYRLDRVHRVELA